MRSLSPITHFLFRREKKLLFPLWKLCLDRSARRVNRPSWWKFLEWPRFQWRKERKYNLRKRTGTGCQGSDEVSSSCNLPRGNILWSIATLNQMESCSDHVERASSRRGESNFSNWFRLNWRTEPPSIEIARFVHQLFTHVLSFNTSPRSTAFVTLWQPYQVISQKPYQRNIFTAHARRST